MNYEIAERKTVKTSAIAFFDQHAQLWSDRYSDPGNGKSLQERHNTVMGLIADAQPSPATRFLDLGCGAGLLSMDLASRNFGGIGVDGAPAMIERCRRQAEEAGVSDLWQYEQSDVERIPFADASFDVAICCGVIEYLPDDSELLQEVKRVLRPGGRFVLCVTNKYSWSAILFPLFQWLKQNRIVVKLAGTIRGKVTGGRADLMTIRYSPRRHRPRDIRRALEAYGFRIEEDRYAGFSMLPGPFNVLFWKLEQRVSGWWSKLDRTPLRRFGSYYVVRSRTEQAHQMIENT